MDSPYTIEVWIRPNSMGLKGIVGWGNCWQEHGINELGLASDGLDHYWDCDWMSGLPNYALVAATPDLSGAWHHVAATCDGGTRRLFLDGVLIGSDSVPSEHDVPPAGLTIGQSLWGYFENAGYYFDGAIGQVSIWATALDQAAIVAWKDRNITPNHPNFSQLAAYWPMTEGSGSVLGDASENGNEATLYGYAPATWVDTTPAANLTGLLPGTTYHFRFVAGNSAGTNYGSDMVFTTPEPELQAVAISLERFANTSAKLLVDKLLAMDYDTLGEDFSLDSVSPLSAQGATIEVDGDWILYEPPPGFNDADTFTYTIVNTDGLRATGTVTVLVVPLDNSPTRNIRHIETIASPDNLHQWKRVCFVGIPGRTYAVQATASLSVPNWVTLGMVVADDHGLYEFTDQQADQYTTRFYRAVSP